MTSDLGQPSDRGLVRGASHSRRSAGVVLVQQLTHAAKRDTRSSMPIAVCSATGDLASLDRAERFLLTIQ